MNEKYKTMYNQVVELLSSYAVDEYAKDTIAPLVAEKSLLKNHLYQDLGLNNRIEMGKFMKKHFPTLASKKPKDKLWKKFIYDEIGEIAPACASCDDQINCFSCLVAELSI